MTPSKTESIKRRWEYFKSQELEKIEDDLHPQRFDFPTVLYCYLMFREGLNAEEIKRFLKHARL